MDEIIAQVVTAFAPVVGLILASLVSWGTVELTRYVKSRTKSEAALSAVKQICAAADLTVAKINQKIVPALKQKSADGKLTDGDISYVKDIAMKEIRQQIPVAIKAAAHLSVESVTTLIENQVEKSVGEQKAKKKEVTA